MMAVPNTTNMCLKTCGATGAWGSLHQLSACAVWCGAPAFALPHLFPFCLHHSLESVQCIYLNQLRGLQQKQAWEYILLPHAQEGCLVANNALLVSVHPECCLKVCCAAAACISCWCLRDECSSLTLYFAGI